MNRKALQLCALVLLTLLAGAALAQQKVIRLTSLEWPPYSGRSVAEQGASVAVVRAAAEAMGYRLEVTFLPWSRAVAMAEDPRSGVHGYFPEYHSDDVARRFLLSQPIGGGPLGFVERKAAPMRWSTLEDLRGVRVGTVRDYVNTTEFDAMVAAGTLKVEAVNDDATNIRKVGAGRIPVAVIDRNVLRFLLATDPSLVSFRDKVQFNERLLEDKVLYIAFQRTPAGREAAAVINQGLEKIDVAAINARFFPR